MKDSSIYYGIVFIYSSEQFCGNIDNYFASHSKKAIIFSILPRVKNAGNTVRVYNMGHLSSERKVKLSENAFLYYVKWYLNYIWIVLSNTSREEQIVIISFHPITFFFSSLQKAFRRITFVYWVGDYFLPTSLLVWIFEKIKKFYHDRIKYTCYLGDKINKEMNGRILSSYFRKTIMWGVKRKFSKNKTTHKNFQILFVGVIKGGQGIEKVFPVLKANKNYKLSIVGLCDKDLFVEHSKIIKNLQIEKQVYFPNRFFSDEELAEIAKESDVGIALYDITPTNPAFYTDPGKVKSYIEMGLPVIMSDISAVAPYIKKYHAGEIVGSNSIGIEDAIRKINKNYSDYQKGIDLFLNHFAFEKYYREKFMFLETENKSK